MRLLTKTSYYYTLYTIPILIISAVFFYFFLVQEMQESNEAVLESRVKIIQNYLKNENQVLLKILESNNELTVTEIGKNDIISQKIKDTLIFSKLEKEDISYKMLEVSSIINGKNYKIKVLRNSIEFDELMEVVLTVFIGLLILLFSILFFINLFISKRIWQPFRTTLHFIKHFEINSLDNKKLERNAINEFDELNKSINIMLVKMVSDYQNQKKFAENASHEFQTPFAIIKSKIGLLLQNKNLDEESLKLLISIEDTTTRLSRINKSLLLLSKIENRQYAATEQVTLFPLIEKLIVANEDLIEAKKLKIVLEDSSTIRFNINAELGYMLFNNLLQNAIRHNVEKGSIIIAFKENTVVISNTGVPIPLNDSVIYERFEKNSSHANSIGLGLSIVKEIAEVYSIAIAYSYENERHYFSLNQFA
jgi:signal transduction histidine kinase